MLPTMTVLLLAIVGQIGPVPQVDSPVSTIAALSLPATDDSPAMVLCVYRLNNSTEHRALPSAAELVPVVRELVAPATWAREGVYLRAINDRLIVRQSIDVQRQIVALLAELEVIEMQRGDSDWPGLRSVIPVVGERPTPRR